VRYPLVVNDIKVGSYTSDFNYRERDGREVVEDVKGVVTLVYKLKRALMRALYGIVIEEI
jgi:hypothetical protein